MIAAGDAICAEEMRVGRAVEERSFAERGAVVMTFRSMMAGWATIVRVFWIVDLA